MQYGICVHITPDIPTGLRFPRIKRSIVSIYALTKYFLVRKVCYQTIIFMLRIIVFQDISFFYSFDVPHLKLANFEKLSHFLNEPQGKQLFFFLFVFLNSFMQIMHEYFMNS